MHVYNWLRCLSLSLSCTVLDAAAADAWQDPATGLHWAKTDNGQEITWEDAKAYCGHMGNGWRLPTIDELDGLHAAAARAKQHAPCGDTVCQAPLPVRLSAPWHWSSTPVTKEQAQDFDELAWGLTLVNGHRTMNLQFFAYGARALCVRNP
jgi:formylglycine-generating enzyme required for sulfatase activity